jgi:hypothetical protein
VSGLPAVFWWGVLGSAAVEIVTMWGYYEHDSDLPKRYKQLGFWVVRLLLAALGGGLAVAYEITKPLLAANIGAATPLLVRALAEGLRPPSTIVPEESASKTLRR